MNGALEEWIDDTDATYHMADSLDCMRDVEPCSMAARGIEGNVCVAEDTGTLTVVFVDDDQGYLVLICMA